MDNESDLFGSRGDAGDWEAEGSQPYLPEDDELDSALDTDED